MDLQYPTTICLSLRQRPLKVSSPSGHKVGKKDEIEKSSPRDGKLNQELKRSNSTAIETEKYYRRKRKQCQIENAAALWDFKCIKHLSTNSSTKDSGPSRGS